MAIVEMKGRAVGCEERADAPLWTFDILHRDIGRPRRGHRIAHDAVGDEQVHPPAAARGVDIAARGEAREQARQRLVIFDHGAEDGDGDAPGPEKLHGADEPRKPVVAPARRQDHARSGRLPGVRPSNPIAITRVQRGSPSTGQMGSQPEAVSRRTFASGIRSASAWTI